MSKRFVAVTGFIIAGAALVALADYSPQFAIGTAGVLGISILLARSNEVATLANDWKAAIGK